MLYLQSDFTHCYTPLFDDSALHHLRRQRDDDQEREARDDILDCRRCAECDKAVEDDVDHELANDN